MINKSLLINISFIAFLMNMSIPAYAYVDPGTGSMLFSIVLSITGVLFFVINTIWERLKLLFFKSAKTKTKNKIVIYTENKQYYHVFNDIINEFEKRQYPILVYVSDADDEFLLRKYQYVKVENIGKGNRAFSTLAFMAADVCLMTTPGLDVYQLKRSKNVKHYSHIFHCLDEGTRYRLFGLDYYDSVLLNFAESEKYIRELENLRNIRKKELLVVGSPHMDSLLSALPDTDKTKTSDKITILLAPSWGDSAILANYGEKLISALAKLQMHTIVRPHPQSLISEKQVITNLQKQFEIYDNITWDFSRNNLETMADSDILITDFSSIIYEFLFLFNKPCIYSLNSYNRELYDLSDLKNSTPYRDTILNKLGAELTLENISNIENIIKTLINKVQCSNELYDIKNTIWQKQGQGAKNVADFLIQKQKEVSEC